MSTALRIGALAARARMSVEALRYYERKGLMPAPQRTAGNYRVYDVTLVERLLFIRNCRSLDMTLAEIRELLRLRDAGEDDCAPVDALLEGHIRQVSARIDELRQLRQQLRTLRGRCAAPRAAAQCGILSSLGPAVPSASG